LRVVIDHQLGHVRRQVCRMEDHFRDAALPRQQRRIALLGNLERGSFVDWPEIVTRRPLVTFLMVILRGLLLNPSSVDMPKLNAAGATVSLTGTVVASS
jgi:hypothetical protein